MPSFSFRFKILLSMMLVVAGVSGGALYLTQQSIRQVYDRIFDGQFAKQQFLMAYAQKALLEKVQKDCQGGMKNVRIQSALRELNYALADGKSEGLDLFRNQIYLTARDELFLRQMWLEPEQRDGPSESVATFFRLFDERHELIEPPASVDVGEYFLSEAELEGLSLEDLFELALEEGGGSIAGRTTFEKPNQSPVLMEFMVITPIYDLKEGYFIGTLLVSFPAPENAVFAEGNKLNDELLPDSGVYLGGRLFSRSLSKESVLDLQKQLTVQTGQAAPSVESNFSWNQDGSPYKVYHAAMDNLPGLPPARLVSLFSLREQLTEQQRTQSRMILIASIGLLVALILSLMLSYGLVVPIRNLVLGTEKVNAGDFQVQVPVRQRDEIGRLTESFNAMVQGLALKEKFRGLLDKVTDRDVAEELVSGRIELGGESRDVSVLFCDIRGFTALTQDMDPQEVISMLNEHFTPLTQIVARHQGVVDKFVGDLIMAVFGAPKSYGADAKNCVRCAIEMIEERQRLNREGKYRIDMGIGIASGEVVAGNMGSDDRNNYTVLGKRVNLSSRLCGAAGRNEIVIDEQTRVQLEDAFEWEPLEPMELKGFSAPVAAFKIRRTDGEMTLG